MHGLMHVEKSSLAAEAGVLRLRPSRPNAPARDPESPLECLVGSSAAMKKLRATLVRVSRSDSAVLVNGPTGTGKELVVRAIHALSARAQEPLFDLNCGSIPSTLIEAQLFGHRRGAFTGADNDQLGYLSAVNQGSLFLDEIAELPMSMQTRLLRVLETRRFRPLGSNDECIFSGRIIAATHADLPRRVEAREFREDLYFRLNVLTVQVPSLAERREDIPELVAHFVAQQSRPLHFLPATLQRLAELDWPGNVRQLRHLIDRLAVLAENEVITPDDVTASMDPRRRPSGGEDALDQLVEALLLAPISNKLEAIEERLIAAALKRTEGNKCAAARILGVHRKFIERRVAPRAVPPSP